MYTNNSQDIRQSEDVYGATLDNGIVRAQL